MKFLQPCLSVVLAISSTLFAQQAPTVHYVSNDPSVPADFNDAQAAADAAAGGDILVFAPTNISYGTLDIEKQLTIKGTGFGATENNIPLANAGRVIFGPIDVGAFNDQTISDAARNTIITGITTDSSIDIYSSGVLIDRCLVSSNININGVNDPATNVMIRRTEMARVDMQQDGTSVDIANCIFSAFSDSSADVDFIADIFHCILLSQGQSSEIQVGSFNIKQLDVRNCLFLGISSNNVRFTNWDTLSINNCFIFNWKTASQTPPQTLATFNTLYETTAETENIFTGSGFFGKEYELAQGSAAIGAGSDIGVPLDQNPNARDLGIYGGLFPWVVGAFPEGPRIEELLIIQSNNEAGLTFRIKASSQE